MLYFWNGSSLNCKSWQCHNSAGTTVLPPSPLQKALRVWTCDLSPALDISIHLTSCSKQLEKQLSINSYPISGRQNRWALTSTNTYLIDNSTVKPTGQWTAINHAHISYHITGEISNRDQGCATMANAEAPGGDYQSHLKPELPLFPSKYCKNKSYISWCPRNGIRTEP